MKRFSLNFLVYILFSITVVLTATNSSGEEQQRMEKFQELEKKYEGSPEMINFTKASWLTSRGNHYGERGLLDEAISDFEEAIGIKSDFFPAYMSLGIAYREKGMHKKALAVLNNAPSKMKINGSELSGFEFELYYVTTSVYVAMQNKSKAIEYAKKALAVANDPKRIEQRQLAEKAGVISTGSDSEIIASLKQLLRELEGR